TLAGGAAPRMGGTATTRLPIGGTPTVERVLRSTPAARRIVVGPDGPDGPDLAARHGARFVLEDPPRSGPLAALARGVAEIPEDAADVTVLVLGGDMPMLRPETLEALLTADPTGSAVTALAGDDGQVQFLCAAWPLRRLRSALAAVENPGGGWADLSLRRLYAQLGHEELTTRTPAGSESADIDTPDSLDRVRRAAGPRIALAQIRVDEDPQVTARTVRRAVADGAAAGAQLVLLPEATLTPFGTNLRRAAEERHEAFVALLEDLAATHGLTVVAGSFSPTDDGRVHNTLVARGGGISAEYRKIHLFDAYGTRESDTVAAGDELVTIDLDGTRIGLATCYDVRFPEQFVELARRGAQAVLLPMAWAPRRASSTNWSGKRTS